MYNVETEFPPVPRRKGSNVIAAIVLAMIVTILAGVITVIMVRWHHATNDSGVAACRAITQSVKSGDTKDDSNTPMSEASYKHARAAWEHSKYADLRTAGTAIVDTIYKLDTQSSTDDSLGDAMTTLIVLRTNWGVLQNACGNHGVIVPNLPDGSSA